MIFVDLITLINSGVNTYLTYINQGCKQLFELDAKACKIDLFNFECFFYEK